MLAYAIESLQSQIVFELQYFKKILTGKVYDFTFDSK